jgi:hypothetical protein
MISSTSLGFVGAARIFLVMFSMSLFLLSLEKNINKKERQEKTGVVGCTTVPSTTVLGKNPRIPSGRMKFHAFDGSVL